MMIVLKIPWNKAVELKYDLSAKNITCIITCLMLNMNKLTSKVLFHSKDVGHGYNVTV